MIGLVGVVISIVLFNDYRLFLTLTLVRAFDGVVVLEEGLVLERDLGV